MKRFYCLILFLILNTGLMLGAPRVKIVTSYVTPDMLAKNSVFTDDSTVANGLNTVARGTYVYLRAWNFGDTASINSANWTFISKPAGSNATLIPITGLSWWSKFKADSTGTYEINVSVTTSTGTHDTITKIYSAKYVGTGGFDGVIAQYPNCMSCHGSTPEFQDIFNRWKTTAHANTFKDNITSGSPSFGVNDFKYHTVGYDQDIVADNDGFDDRARQLGWIWSNYSPPKSSNWDSLKNRFPSLVAFAGVGCESCHGPGTEHIFGGGDTNKIQRSLNEGVCGKCHDAPPQQPVFGQWKNAKHSNVIWNNAFAQNNNGTNNLDNCIRCHDGTGYVNFTKATGTNTNGFTIAKQEMIACAVCHDPHGSSNQFQLRSGPPNSDTLANGFHYTNVGSGAVCMDCHKARKDAATYTLTRVTSSTWGPHHSGQSDIYEAQNAITFGGPQYQTTAHKEFLVKSCVSCHMPVTDTTSENRDKVGGHSLLLHNEETDFDYLKACQTCHFGKTRFDQFIAPYDYDGDGTIEPWRLEIDGCLTKLRISLPPVGVDSVAWQLIAADSNNVTLRQAYWNYQLVNEGSERGMHNPKYSVDVLLRSVQALTGIIPVSNEIPAKFELTQNYPNPFNPSTKFAFSIPSQMNVIIKIYDIGGREVRTLVNERLSPGKYDADWNSVDNSGSSVSSGVYFYRIIAGNFAETKKMILIR
jgi:predicted CXXCH cytochrome family protein